ncbi:MAG: HAD-IA family hydrolase [Acidimicrobiaceae bacterium]|nr:HAD-IA family hydrolase [Acidimicrobiaceae bacterium]
MSTPRTRGLLFDCDGVLVDSKAAAEEAWSAWSAHYGLDTAEVLTGIHGRRSVDTVARHLPQTLRAEATALIDRLEIGTAYRATPVPGAATLVSKLPPLSYAVVTSAPARLCHARLAAAELPLDRVLVTSEDVAHGKPEPDCYQLGAERLGVGPADCVVFEDSAAGIAAARAAGAGFVVGVGADAGAHGADVVLADLTSLDWQDGQLVIR